MAFCKFCGTQLPDDAVFCPGCGKQKSAPAVSSAGVPSQGVPTQTPCQQQAPYQQQAPNQAVPAQPFVQNAAPAGQGTAGKPKSKLVPILIAAAAVIAVFFLFKMVSNGTGIGSNYETPVKYFCEGISEASISKLYKAFPPAFEDTMSSMMSIYGMDNTDLLDSLGSLSGAGMKTTYEIISREKLSAEELAEYSEDLSYSYSTPIIVSQGYLLNVCFVVGGEESYEEIAVGKVGGRWCIIEDFF